MSNPDSFVVVLGVLVEDADVDAPDDDTDAVSGSSVSSNCISSNFREERETGTSEDKVSFSSASSIATGVLSLGENS